MTTRLYTIAQLVNLPDVPGLYAWYFKFDPNLDHIDYHKVFKNKQVDTIIKGNLQEIFKGPLICHPHSFVKHPITDFAALSECTDFFSPPIYIGIAKKSLRTRLPQHVEKLRKLLYSRFRNQGSAAPLKAASDTDEESNVFAQRIFDAVSEMKNVGLTSFMVKTVELTPNYSEAEIQALEYFLNRTYVPLYGRR